jgi:hypothetical protein
MIVGLTVGEFGNGDMRQDRHQKKYSDGQAIGRSEFSVYELFGSSRVRDLAFPAYMIKFRSDFTGKR